MLRQAVIALIVIYQRCISPLTGPSCRFHPTCSSYALQAIDRYGLGKGVLLFLRRFIRCHPWHPGGHDPVR